MSVALPPGYRTSLPENGTSVVQGADRTTAELLDELVEFVRRYVVVTAAQADALALFVMHTYVVGAAHTTPYLAVTSAEKRSGKSRVLEVLTVLVKNPLPAAGATVAALFRSLSDESRTLLHDEVDAVFGPKATNHEDLRALLNAGYRRGMPVLRCVGEGSKQQVVSFEVFCPKVLAGIGALPDTIADRSLPIRLKRRSRSEEIQRFTARRVEQDTAPLRASLESWAERHELGLALAQPALPDELDDRAQDAVEALLAIADTAGEMWAERARAALVELRSTDDEDADSIGIRLLSDIRAVFDRVGDPVATETLLDALSAIDEAPWGDWRGKPLAARSLASLLRPYGVRSRTVRLKDADRTSRGYKRESFGDVFARYLPPETGSYPTHPTQSASHAGLSPFFYPTQEAFVSDSETPANPHGSCDVSDVSDRGACTGRDGSISDPDEAEIERLAARARAIQDNS